MTQLFIDLFDIIPTEGKWVEDKGFSIDPDEAGHLTYESWLEDVRKNGVKYQLLVHSDGHIADGNFRYWCLRHLWEETGDWKWRRVPINPWFYMGICFGIGDENSGKHISFRASFLSEIPISMQTKEKVEKTWPYLKDFPDDKLGHGFNPYSAIKELLIFPFTLNTICPKCKKPIAFNVMKSSKLVPDVPIKKKSEKQC